MAINWVSLHAATEAFLAYWKSSVEYEEASQKVEKVSQNFRPVIAAFFEKTFEAQMELCGRQIVSEKEEEFGFHLASILVLKETLIYNVTASQRRAKMVHSLRLSLEKMLNTISKIIEEEAAKNIAENL